MKLEVNLNLAQLNREIERSFKATVDAYSEQCRVEIETEQWSWDGFTLRSDGSIAGSPRDIVDTGNLRDSQQEPDYLDANTVIIVWTADYAKEVHDGIPGEKIARPWTQRALEHLDLGEVMAKELKKRLK